MTLKSLNFTLLVANLEDETLVTLDEELNKKRLMAPDFFSQAPMVVNIVNTSLNIDFLKLKNTVEDNGFLLTGITGNISEEQKQKAVEHSISVLHSSKKKVIKEVDINEKLPVATQDLPFSIEASNSEEMALSHDLKAKVHIGRVRSGQQIYAKESDLVISGDVGAGAEVIADGSIHIYGTLRGKALAGAMGNTNAAIFCQNLQPELVSIAGVYKLSETLPIDVCSTSCSVFLKDQKLVFSNLNKI